MLFAQEFTELTDACRFTGTLQARHQHHGGWLRGQVQALVFFAHRRHQFVTNNLHELLAWRQAFVNFMPYRFLFYAVNEVTHHRQRDVGFQQRHAHFAQRLFNVVFSQAPTAADIAQRARQTVS